MKESAFLFWENSDYLQEDDINVPIDTFPLGFEKELTILPADVLYQEEDGIISGIPEEPLDLSFILFAAYLPEHGWPNKGRKWDGRFRCDPQEMKKILDEIRLGLQQDDSGIAGSWPSTLPPGYSISIKQWIWWKCYVFWLDKPNPPNGNLHDTSLPFQNPTPKGSPIIRNSRKIYEEQTSSRVYTRQGGPKTIFTDNPHAAGKTLNDIIRARSDDLIDKIKIEYHYHTSIIVTYTAVNGQTETSSIDYYWISECEYQPDGPEMLTMTCRSSSVSVFENP